MAGQGAVVVVEVEGGVQSVPGGGTTCWRKCWGSGGSAGGMDEVLVEWRRCRGGVGGVGAGEDSRCLGLGQDSG